MLLTIHDVHDARHACVHFLVSPESSVAVSPSMEISSIRGSVAFSCSAQGGPDNGYQWQYNGVVLMDETNTSLTIDDIGAVNGGDYTCVVSNAADSDSATATLYVAPAIVTQPTDILTRNGTIVNFTCEAESFPAPTYLWERYDETMATFISIGSDPVLEFSPAVFGDEDSYCCIASLPETDMIDTSTQVVLAGTLVTTAVLVQ